MVEYPALQRHAETLLGRVVANDRLDAYGAYMHPDEIHRFSKSDAKAIRSAIGRFAKEDLHAILVKWAKDPLALDGIAAWIRVDDRLVVQHDDPERQTARDAFLDSAIGWAETAGATHFTDRLRRCRKLVGTIEHGYRLISRSLDDLPFSRLPRDRQLAAGLRRAALDFDDLISRGPSLEGRDGAFDYMSETVVSGDDGRPVGVDSMTASLVDLVSNLIEFLAFGAWPSEPGALRLPIPPTPTDQEVEDAGPALLLSMSWSRWTRWEREARYWEGNIERVPQDQLPSETGDGSGLTIYQHDRGIAASRDWISVERLKLLQRQNLAELLSKYPLNYAGPKSARLPPQGFTDAAEFLGATLLFAGAHLNSGDATAYGGATLTEWLRGYSVLRQLGQHALEETSGPDRHLIYLNRHELTTRLIGAGLSEEGARSFVIGATYRKKSIDLFDNPLLWLGGDRYLVFGPAIANVDAGRAVLSNLPSLGFKLDHKGHTFESNVFEFLASRGAQPIVPVKRKYAGEEYQIDVVLPWGDYLFLFECKNLAPSNLHPKTAFEFWGDHLENVRQADRLADGLRRHPELLTDAGGPDPAGRTIVPVVLYAMPFAMKGSHSGVYTTDFSMLSRFFRSGELAVETVFGVGAGDPVIHRQVTERIWRGDLPTPDDLRRALDDPWPVRFVEERAVAEWVYVQLAPYQLARSPDYRIGESSRAEIAARYDIDLRAWEAELERLRKKALTVRSRRQRRAAILETRRFRAEKAREHSRST